jgi:membrane protease YdiL (CAAX protease family)
MPELSALSKALWVSADVTAAVAVIAAALPASLHTTLVGLVFLAVTWALVWRGDDAEVQRAGLALGGVVIPGRFDGARAALAGARALAWAFGLWAAIAVPFFLLWRFWWAPALTFSLSARPLDTADELLGQIFVIALPEEAFYRGYLQSRLDQVWSPRWGVLGASSWRRSSSPSVTWRRSSSPPGSRSFFRRSSSAGCAREPAASGRPSCFTPSATCTRRCSDAGTECTEKAPRRRTWPGGRVL